MLKRKTTHWKWALSSLPALLLGVWLLYWAAAWKRNGARRASCQRSLQMIARAIAQYTQDYDGRFPLTTVGGTSVSGWPLGGGSTAGVKHPKASYGLPVGWADAIQPQLRTQARYHCPSANIPIRVGPPGAGYTDYWMNGNLSGMSRKSLALPRATLLLGEGGDGVDVTNATYSKTSLPAAWLSNRNSPAWRHLGGANYLFADGHVAWLKPNEVTSCSGRKDCFAIR